MHEVINPARIFPFSMRQALPLDLADAAVDVSDHAAFTRFLAQKRGSAPALYGGWNEHRGIYTGSALFGGVAHGGDEPRVIHLGIDIWTASGTPVRAPLGGVVHSVADNARFGDYGGTVILEHPGPLWTLWGHLALRSLEGKSPGQPVARGEIFAWVGEPHENGGWPPHLHVQKITDMLGLRGDFPGVARMSERDYWLGLCPDPTDLLA
ncbi:MAG TPA: peptidoglycan DD-metalloendopeptidase family protein [Candidatus Krumholzibacteria bacterium]|nr:peptidoglycan DD-metalloendopeptidase family protein [Candidatus Krumholzibacteria bacterium]